MEQYSTNSNQAIIAIIQSHPTLIGQYRAAWMHYCDRCDSLASCAIAVEKERNQIQIVCNEISCLAVKLESTEDDLQREKIELKIKKKQIEIAEQAIGLERSLRLVKDAQRERSVALHELDRIRGAIGFDPEKLSEAQFQLLMAEEHIQKENRWILSRTIAPFLGVLPEAIEKLLELPEERLQNIMLQHHVLVAQLAGSLIPQHQQLEDSNHAAPR